MEMVVGKIGNLGRTVMREGIGKEGAMFNGKGGWKNWKFGQDSVLFLKFRRGRMTSTR